MNPVGWTDPEFQRDVMVTVKRIIAQHAGKLNGLLRALVLRLRLSLLVDTVAILLVENGFVVAKAASGLEEEVDRDLHIPVGEGFAGRIVAIAQPIILDDVDHADVFNPLLREKRLKSMLGVPLLAGGAVRGVLHVGLRRSHKFESHDIELLQRVAKPVAEVIEKAQAGG